MQLLSSFFIWLKKKVARTTYLAPQLLSTTVEVMAPDNSWFTTNLGVNFYIQRSYVARSFVQKHNLDAIITHTLASLVTKAYLHVTNTISYEVLLIRLRLAKF